METLAALSGQTQVALIVVAVLVCAAAGILVAKITKESLSCAGAIVVALICILVIVLPNQHR